MAKKPPRQVPKPPSFFAAKSAGPPPPGDPPASLLWPGALAALCLLVYLYTLDLRANFDSLVAAAWVESWRPRHGLQKLFAWNHFLFNGTGWLLFWVFRPLNLSGYRTLQVLNAFAATGALLILYRVLERRCRDAAWAAAWTLLAAFSNIYWREAVSGEAYTAGMFWVCACAAVSCAYLDAPSIRRIAAATLCSCLAALYHTGNAVSGVLVLLALFLARSPRRPLHFGIAAGVGALLALPYALVQELFSPARIQAWFISSSYAARAYEGTLTSSAWKFDPFGGLRLIVHSVLHPAAGRFSTLGLGVLFALALLRRRGERPDLDEPARRSALLLFGTALLAYFIFYSSWMSAAAYWCVHVPLLCGTLALFGPPERRRAVAVWAVFAAALAIGSINLVSSALPNRDIANFPSVAFSRKLGESTPPGAHFVISGMWSDLKVHIPYFGRRKRIALDLYLIGAPKERALARVGEDLAALRRSGVPTYILSELRAPAAQKALAFGWGVLPADLEGLFSPYRFQAVGSFDVPGEGRQEIILLRPKDDSARLLNAYLTKAGFPDQAR